MDRNAWPPQQQHRRGHSVGSARVRAKDEDLALFQNMSKREQTPFLYPAADDELIDATLSTKFGGLSYPHSAPPLPRSGIGAELLNSDADKTDYDWLMTPPGTPLFPSLDADSPALQQGVLINRSSLAAIKTSRGSNGTRAVSPAARANRGNPSPNRRPSTPQSGQSSSSGAVTRSHSLQLPARNVSNNRPATPTRSSTPTSVRASPTLQPRPSTPTRQNSAPARPVTPLGARPATPTRKPATPTSSGRPSSTPTLRRSSSSPTGSQAHAGISARGNPSPTRSTASTGTSARGASPVRSGTSRGVSPVRGGSPAPSRGRSPSPSMRAPSKVEASGAVPPSLRTTPDRSSSAQRRAVAYGASPGQVPPRSVDPVPTQRRTASPARPVRSSSLIIGQNVDRLSRAVSSDSESSFDTCSQSGVSSGHGVLTPERSGSARRMFGLGSDDYGRSSSLKGRRSSSSSPQFGPSSSKKSFESAARVMHFSGSGMEGFDPVDVAQQSSNQVKFFQEYHRGQVAAFRPLMTNSSISTFYSSRASGLLRRPLTPSSTASSSEHGATVAHDSKVDDEEAGSAWKPLHRQASEAQSPLHLFNKSLSPQETDTLGGASTLADNEEMSSFFRNPVLALEAESKDESLNAEINWLSRNDPEDTEYLWSRDVKDGESHPAFDLKNSSSRESGLSRGSYYVENEGDGAGTFHGSKPGPSGLEKIRDKLRHLKSTTENEDAEAASRMQQFKSVPSAVTNPLCDPGAATAVDGFVDGDSPMSTAPELQGICDVCGHRKQQAGGDTSEWSGCHCSAIVSQPAFHAREGLSSRPSSAEPGSSTKMEKTESDSTAANMVYGKERDIWYIYRHSSEYEVTAAGFSEEKMEIDPPQILAKDVHMRGNIPASNPVTICAQQEYNLQREDVTPIVDRGKIEHALGPKSKGQKLVNGAIQKVSADVPIFRTSHGECSSSLGVPMNAASGASLERKALHHAKEEVSTSGDPSETGKESTPQSGSPEGGYGLAFQKHKQVSSESGRVFNQEVVDQSDKESRQACSPERKWGKPLIQMQSELPEISQVPAPSSVSLSQPAIVVNSMPNVFEAEGTTEISLQPSATRMGNAEYGPGIDVQASSETFPVDSSSNVALPAEEHRHMRVEPCRPAEEKASEKGPLQGDMRITPLPPSADTGRSEVKRNEDHASVTPKDKASWKEEEMPSRIRYGMPGAGTHSRVREGDEDAFIDIPVDPCGRVTAEPRVSGVICKAAPHTGLVSAAVFTESNCLRPASTLTEGNLAGLQGGSPVFMAGENLKQLDRQEQDKISCETHYLEKDVSTSTEHFDTPACDVWTSLKLPYAVHGTEANAQNEKERSELPCEGKPFRRYGSGPQGSLSKSSSSKSSFRTPTSGSSIDLSRSTDTTSSCPSNASWEDPPFGSKFWDSRSASDVARVSDVSEPAPPPTKAFRSEAFEQNHDHAKVGGHEVKAGDMASHSGELQESNREEAGIRNVDQRIRVPPDEISEEHFDYIFEYLGTKRGPSPPPADALPIVSRLIPVTPSQEDVANSGNSELAKTSSIRNSGSPVAETNGTAKVSEIYTEMALAKSQSLQGDLNNPRAEFEPSGISSAPPSKAVMAQPSVKEEIVESTVSPGSSTRKYMSSFKFSHKKPVNSELNQSSTTSGSPSKVAMEGYNGQQSDSAGGAPSSRITNKPNGRPAATPPHLNKGKSMRAASPARPPPAASAKVPARAQGTNGELLPEELSIHSRFSNITVRSGSDTENFDWGPSSLEATGSRCGSSSRSDSASMAVLRSTPELRRLDLAHGDAVPSSGGGDQDQPSNFPPSQRSPYTEIQSEASSYFHPSTAPSESAQLFLNHSAPECRNPMEAHSLEPGGWMKGHSDQKLSPDTGVALLPMRPEGRASLVTPTPKQNLDKLGEKLEQLETFGARVLLRNPQQQFMHSPSGKDRPLAGDAPLQHVGVDSGRVAIVAPLQPPTSSSTPSKCRCTIL